VFVPLDAVSLDALNDPDFSGVDSGGSPGFGGVDPGFSHGGRVHGALETQPHDWVHGLIGGGRSNLDIGLMSNPDTAALDPIFWLHHANIDRLWQVWRESSAGHTDPTDARWLAGPASIGERADVAAAARVGGAPAADGRVLALDVGRAARAHLGAELALADARQGGTPGAGTAATPGTAAVGAWGVTARPVRKSAAGRRPA